MSTIIVILAVLGGTVGFMYLLIKGSMLLNRGSATQTAPKEGTVDDSRPSR